jgi:hypothetical protein
VYSCIGALRRKMYGIDGLDIVHSDLEFGFEGLVSDVDCHCAAIRYE